MVARVYVCGCRVPCVCVQLAFKSAQRHKHHVQDIMMDAASQQMFPNGPFRKPLLGVLYDECCRSVFGFSFVGVGWACACACGRKHWADKSSKLGAAYSVNAEIAKGKSTECLQKATSLHDSLFKNLPSLGEVRLAVYWVGPWVAILVAAYGRLRRHRGSVRRGLLGATHTTTVVATGEGCRLRGP